MPIILYVDVIMDDLIHAMKLSGIRRCADMCGWNVVVCGERQSRPDKLAKKIEKLKPVGCIVECSSNHDDLPPSLFGNIPVVYLDSSPALYGSKVHKIIHDGQATTRVAYGELSSNNPSAYAVVDYREKRYWPNVRVRVFRELAEASGKECSVFSKRNESANARFKRLSSWVENLPQRCAVFAVNDYTAREVVAAAKAVGRKIPNEITLIGVDNLKSLCEQESPNISSVQVDFERAGYKAAKRMGALLFDAGAGTENDRFGPLMVVRRESTRGYGRCEPRILAAVELIRREACNGLTASDVIKSVRGSRRLTEIRFREAMGHSILDEILGVRMEKVQFLLSMTDTPIGAIAAMCGFRSEIALHKFFKLSTGMCMREWRKRNSKR